MLVLVSRVAGTHSGAIFNPFQASFRRYLNAVAGASFSCCRRDLRRSKSAIFGAFWGYSFSSCRCHIQALFTMATSAGFKCFRRPFRAPFSNIQSTIQPHSKPVSERIGMHSGGCSPSHLWWRSHCYQWGCSSSRWPRHAWRCWGWSSPRVAEN